MNYAKARDANEVDIVDTFRRLGASVERIDVPCDLIVGFRGETHLVEVKNPESGPVRLTPSQVDFREKHRGDYTIVETTDDAIRLVASWCGPIIGDCLLAALEGDKADG